MKNLDLKTIEKKELLSINGGGGDDPMGTSYQPRRKRK